MGVPRCVHAVDGKTDDGPYAQFGNVLRGDPQTSQDKDDGAQSEYESATGSIDVKRGRIDDQTVRGVGQRSRCVKFFWEAWGRCIGRDLERRVKVVRLEIIER